MNHLTCLLIDDDKDEHEIFSLALEEGNIPIRLFTAFNGKSVLQLLDNGIIAAPDFIFLDINMPEMNGKQVLGEIKRRPLLRNIPVIMYSTSSDEREMKETKQLGAAGFVVKQSRISDLAKILSDYFINTHTLGISKYAKRLLEKW